MRETKVKFQLEKNILFEPAPLRESIGDGAVHLFYVRAEYDSIMAENHATIEMMNNGFFGNANFCCRGLESKTRLAGRRKHNMKRRARAAVLGEQQRQHDENNKDPEMISEIYKGFTIPCRTQAQRQGTRDYECAARISSRKRQAPKSKTIDFTYFGSTTVASNEFIAGILSLSDENDTGSVLTEEGTSLSNRTLRAVAA
jgi:hypothetical protein